MKQHRGSLISSLALRTPVCLAIIHLGGLLLTLAVEKFPAHAQVANVAVLLPVVVLPGGIIVTSFLQSSKDRRQHVEADQRRPQTGLLHWRVTEKI